MRHRLAVFSVVWPPLRQPVCAPLPDAVAVALLTRVFASVFYCVAGVGFAQVEVWVPSVLERREALSVGES